MKRFTVTYKSSYGFQVEQPVEAIGPKQAEILLRLNCHDVKKILKVQEG